MPGVKRLPVRREIQHRLPRRGDDVSLASASSLVVSALPTTMVLTACDLLILPRTHPAATSSE
jgi:hypothetical protein